MEGKFICAIILMLLVLSGEAASATPHYRPPKGPCTISFHDCYGQCAGSCNFYTPDAHCNSICFYGCIKCPEAPPHGPNELSLADALSTAKTEGPSDMHVPKTHRAFKLISKKHLKNL